MADCPNLYRATRFVDSAIFHHIGPAFAALLFVRIDPLGVAWSRIPSAGIVLTLRSTTGAVAIQERLPSPRVSNGWNHQNPR